MAEGVCSPVDWRYNPPGKPRRFLIMNYRGRLWVLWFMALLLALAGVAGCAKSTKQAAAAKPKLKILSMPVQVPGKFTKEIVGARIRKLAPDALECYQAALVNRPALAGVVRVKWTIMPNGRTAAVVIEKSIPDAKDLENCIVGRIESWRFPSHHGSAARVSYPFIFQPKNP